MNSQMRTDIERFVEKYRVAESGCFEWQGNKTHNGYGQFRYKGAQRRAHRVSYELFVGAIPDGMVVMHKCDNPLCVNPAHLKAGTQQENVQDSIDKGRRECGKSDQKGEKNNRARLTRSQVDEIRSVYASGGVSRAELGRLFGTSKSNIQAIVEGRSWASSSLPLKEMA